MEYIVFDLEWNQCPLGKSRENPRMPFEIIEIGGVKLDGNRKIIGEYRQLIRPQVYKKIHYRTQEILDIKMEDLKKKGIFFYQALREFLAWCGEDYMFCTWGSTDLIELQRNMKYYGIQRLLPGPIRYYDVQKLFSLIEEDGKSRKSLEYAIDYFSIDKSEGFHHALADARYTAMIYGKLDREISDRYFSIDCYQNPKSRKEEVFVDFGTYAKFISKDFDSKESALKDKEVASSPCQICGKNLRKKIRWFSLNSKNYNCLAKCPEHGYMKYKARMKKNDEGRIYVVKTVKPVDEEGAIRLREKKKTMHKRKKQDKSSIDK